MTFRQHIGDEAVRLLHENLDELLDSSGGWVIIANTDKQRICDAYLGVCITCVTHTGAHIVAGAVQAGSLLEEAVAKMAGHKHIFTGPPLNHNHEGHNHG